MTQFALQRLDERARASLLAHFLALSVSDRWLRFGRSLAPTALASYVDRIDFGRDAILGIHDDQDLIVATAHVAFDSDPAEVALSVVPAWRAHGLGRALVAGAVAQAACRGAARLYMQFLAANVPILRIAERFGMAIRLCGRDAEAHLDLSLATQETIRAAS